MKYVLKILIEWHLFIGLNYTQHFRIDYEFKIRILKNPEKDYFGNLW